MRDHDQQLLWEAYMLRETPDEMEGVEDHIEPIIDAAIEEHGADEEEIHMYVTSMMEDQGIPHPGYWGGEDRLEGMIRDAIDMHLSRRPDPAAPHTLNPASPRDREVTRRASLGSAYRPDEENLDFQARDRD